MGVFVSRAQRLQPPTRRVQDSNGPEAEDAPPIDLIDAARQAIWRLFEQGQIDERSATDALLAVDVGIRRTRHVQRGVEPGEGAHDD